MSVGSGDGALRARNGTLEVRQAGAGAKWPGPIARPGPCHFSLCPEWKRSPLSTL